MKGGIRISQHLGYLATGFLVYLLVFFDVLFHGKGTLVRGFDGSEQSFAWLSKLARDWSALEPPLWDFTSFSGTSFIGEVQTGVLYPGNMILGWLAPVVSQHSVDVYIFLHYVLAFYFMALFLRGAGFRLTATLVGAYAFASYLDWVQPHRFVGMVYLPLVLLFFLRSLKQKGLVVLNTWLYLCGMSLGLMILAGHIQPYLHSTIALLLFAGVVGWAPTYSTKRLLYLLQRLTLVGFTSALFSAPQWLMSLEHFARSYRWAPDKTDGLERVAYEVYGFVDVLAPELVSYLLNSWIPVSFGVSLIILLVSKGTVRQFALFGILLLLFASLSGMGDRGYISRITYHIPLLNSAREATRYYFLIMFASSTLLAVLVQSVPGAIGWLRDRWMRKTDSISRQMNREPNVWMQALLIVVLLPPLWSHSSVLLRVQPNDDPLSPVQLFRRGKIIDFLEEQQRTSGRSFRVFNFKQCMPRNLGNAFSVFTIRGHRATILRNYFEYFSGTLGNPLDPKLDVLGVKYVISSEPIEGLQLVMRDNGRYLYERENALTIVHWFDPATGKRRPANLEQIEFNANSVRFALGESARGLLVFSQPFFPGWQAIVGNKTRAIQQTDIFMGIQLAPDEREVTFLYRPSRIWVGLAGTLLILAAFLGSWVIPNRSHDTTANPSGLLKE